MKKKRILSGVALSAAMAGMMLSGAGCTNQVQDLYGPPPETESGYSDQSTTEELASPAETLYGPPAVLGTEADTDPSVPSEEEKSSSTESGESDTSTEEDLSTAMPLYGPPSVLYPRGDVTMDKQVDARDLTRIKEIALGEIRYPGYAEKDIADLNRDGTVDKQDVEKMLHDVLGVPEKEEPVIRVYLDGKQLTDAVTRYQRRNERAYG